MELNGLVEFEFEFESYCVVDFALAAAVFYVFLGGEAKWLRETKDLADSRGTAKYKQAAEILFDLCEAIGGAKGEKIVRQHAAHLAKKHPTLSHLKSSLRKRGLLD